MCYIRLINTYTLTKENKVKLHTKQVKFPFFVSWLGKGRHHLIVILKGLAENRSLGLVIEMIYCPNI